MKNLQQFTNLYPIQKTLRFALRPVGKTKEHLEKYDPNVADGKNLLQIDQELAEKYKLAKKIIDEYHKWFIDKSLSGFAFDISDLNEYDEIDNKILKIKSQKKIIINDNDTAEEKNKKEGEIESRKEKFNELKKSFATIQKKLREQVAECFKNDRLFKKEFIKKDLPQWLLEHPDVAVEGVEDPINIIKGFNNWVTYFDGFNDSRKNIYTAKEHSTGIAYRIVHENLPKFINNLNRFKVAKNDLKVDFSEVETALGIDFREVFSLSYFNKCLTQKGIDRYNLIRGGKSEGVQTQNKKGINNLLNEYVQSLKSKESKASDDEKKDITSKIKKIRSCKLEELYKQILSDRSSFSFRPEGIKNDAELCDLIDNPFYIENGKFYGYQTSSDKSSQSINLKKALKELFESSNDFDQRQIYVKNDDTLTLISKRIFGEWYVIKDAMIFYFTNEKLGQDKRGVPRKLAKSAAEKKLNALYFCVAEIHSALEFWANDRHDENQEEGLIAQARKKPLWDYFKGLKYTDSESKSIDLFEVISKTYSSVQDVLKKYKDKPEEKLKADKKSVSKVKDYLDAVQALIHFIKPLYVWLDPKEKKADVLVKDNSFYFDFDSLYQALEPIYSLYNQVRNYLTKKPYSTEKYKLNFGKGTLLKGFVDSHTEKSDPATQYGAYLFRKKMLYADDYDYYLGISENSRLFRCHEKGKIETSDKSEYERLEYYQPKATTFFSDEYSINKEKLNMYLDTLVTKRYEQLKLTVDGTDGEDFKANKDTIIGNDTPTSKIKEIEEHPYLKDLLIDPELKEICDVTITEFQTNLKNYIKRNPDLKKIIGKNFSKDCEGLKSVIEEAQIVAKKNRTFSYFPVSQQELEEALNFESNNKKPKHPLFLFQIVNKDLMYHENVHGNLRKENKKRTENLHTMYFRHLTKDGHHSIADIGAGEIFHRKISPFYEKKSNIVVHEAGQKIVCKNYSYIDENGSKCIETIPEQIYKLFNKYYKDEMNDDTLDEAIIAYYEKGKQGLSKENANKKLRLLKKNIETRVFDYDIIKNKRYTEDKFLFHLSMILNFNNGPKNSSLFNNQTNTFLQNNPDINIIGIDRGERHLAYYTLINQEGNILEQGSLNNPTDKKDYHELLDKREKERDSARKSWGTIEKIKDQKEGYLSQVVHKIVTMMVEHNAILVLEDLNFGFKKGRFKVEKQVYQKLEKMLIDKLNYLVLKDKKPEETGGLMNALQLTAPFESFKKLGKQTGFMFYVPAYHTSKVCPATGFVNLLYPRYETIKKSQEFFNKFESITYNPRTQYFEFSINYKKFTAKAKGSKQEWTICTHGSRLENQRNQQNQWQTVEVDLTHELKKLFNDQKIEFGNGQDIKKDIYHQDDRKFFKELMRLLKLTLQLRNSRIGSDEDWMISPVKDTHGHFFDSRKTSDTMPKDADANGAYHIALKGLSMLEQLNKTKDVSKPKFDWSNQKWYEFIQNRVR